MIDIIAGARPNFMKIAPIIAAIEKRQRSGSGLTYRLVHTGQHYDARMSGDFFTQLGIPEPHVNLEVGSGTQAEQTAAIMIRYEKLLGESPARICLVVGDVTSTMACTIVAKKQGQRVAHVEGGIRSGDWSMPEEINRVVTDSIADYFFTTSEVANENLRRSGVDDERIFFVGNTMIDSLLANVERLRPPDFWDRLDLGGRRYFLMTLHRPANVDDVSRLTRTLRSIACLRRGVPIVFPAHPRTARKLRETEGVPDGVELVDPQPYLEFNYLAKNAFAVITDSGGVTEESTVLGVPCLTMRETTERPETVTHGTNVLVGSDTDKLESALDTLFAGKWKSGEIPEKWDGRTGERIAEMLERLLLDGR